MKMSNNRFTLLIILMCSFLLQTAHSKNPEIEHRGRLQKLFSDAIAARTAQYTSLREDLLSEDGCLPFLEAQTRSTNLMERVLARGMKSWAEDCELNTTRSALLYALVNEDLGKRQHILGSVQSRALSLDSSGADSQPRDELHKKAAVPFLLEVAIKGLNPGSAEPKTKVRDYSLWPRCYAVSLAGGWPEPDVVAVLVLLLQSSDRYEVRICAATGLRRTGDARAVEPLIAALSDKEEAVRRSAQLGLKDITGQDFGEDTQKYQAWWTDNKDRLLKKE